MERFQSYRVAVSFMFQISRAFFKIRSPQLTMESLDVSSNVCFDHAGNYWRNRRGGYLFSHGHEGYKFPEEKQRVLALIDEGLDCRKH
jgi:hypothetical protein